MFGLRIRKVHQLFGSPFARAFGIAVLANFIFLVLMLLAPVDRHVMVTRVQVAFETGELGVADYLLFDSRRGWHQYNDCNVLQMLANENSSRTERALAPNLFSFSEDWTHQCAVLRAIFVHS